jgi:drug/metabolite transporter (DMT)-like permease
MLLGVPFLGESLDRGLLVGGLLVGLGIYWVNRPSA